MVLLISISAHADVSVTKFIAFLESFVVTNSNISIIFTYFLRVNVDSGEKEDLLELM